VTLLNSGALWDRLRSTYWFIPSLVTLACVGLAAALTWLDRSYAEIPAWMGWAYGGGADGARALLSASSQSVLGAFTGTFAYCLIVLRTVQGDGGDRYDVFVPHLAVTGGVLLTLLSVAMLIYYVHHIAMSMQVSEITARVVEDLERSIDRIYPDDLGDAENGEADGPPVPAAATLIRSTLNGYVQDIDGPGLLAAAARAETTIWILGRPGTFIVEHQPLAAAAPGALDPERLAADIRGTFTFGADRTSRQDVSYAAQQLVEVALRALSPGVNEPFTAIACIDRLTQGLARLARRRLPSAQRTDDQGRTRVVAVPRRFADLVIEVFEPIARHGASEPVITSRLQQVYRTLHDLACRPEDRAAIDRLVEQVRSR
jgi:uncharacterized membrane protein